MRSSSTIARLVISAPDTGPAAAAGGRLQAVLFDMDGLLVDTEPLWFEAESAVMARLGGSWTPADQRRLVGGSRAASLEYMLSKAARPARTDEIDRWLVTAVSGLISSRGVRLLPGAGELAAELTEAGLPIALVTSSDRDMMLAVISRTGIRFQVTVCAADVRRGKPDPEAYLLAARRLGADPRRCVALEDSPNGVASAEAAGCMTIAVPGVARVPEQAGRLVVPSLTRLNLAALRELADRGAGLAAGPGT